MKPLGRPRLPHVHIRVELQLVPSARHQPSRQTHKLDNQWANTGPTWATRPVRYCWNPERRTKTNKCISIFYLEAGLRSNNHCMGFLSTIDNSLRLSELRPQILTSAGCQGRPIIGHTKNNVDIYKHKYTHARTHTPIPAHQISTQITLRPIAFSAQFLNI